MFKICSSYLHGTRGFMNQIKENLIDQQELKNNLQSLTEQLECHEMKSFLLRYQTRRKTKDSLCFKSTFNRTSANTSLFQYIKSFTKDELIYTSDRAIIKNIGVYF
jgi:hypothetical protein